MSLISEYFKLQKTYVAQYGHRALILMQIGSFYEIYGYNPEIANDANETNNELIGHVEDVCEILRMVQTRKDKNKPHSMSNPIMLGFPCNSYENHRDLLLRNFYTLIRIDQVELNPDSNSKSKIVPREVVEISSPTTDLNYSVRTGSSVGKSEMNFLISIYLECQKPSSKLEDFNLSAGISAMEIFTGENFVFEVYSSVKNLNSILQELYRFLSVHPSKEVLIYLSNFPEDIISSYSDYLYSILELSKYPNLIFNTRTLPKEYSNFHYQEQFLSKLFSSSLSSTGSSSGSGSSSVSGSGSGLKIRLRPSSKRTSNSQTSSIPSSIQNKSEPLRTESNFGSNGILIKSTARSGLTMIEELGLEMLNYGRISYLNLLQYCYEHNPRFLENLSRPKIGWSDQDKHLILTHNAIQQLNMLPPENTSSKIPNRPRSKYRNPDCLLDILDFTSTPMGKRIHHNFLLNPITSTTKLTVLNDLIENLLNLGGGDSGGGGGGGGGGSGGGSGGNVSGPDLLLELESDLKSLPDFEQLFRKIGLKVLTFSDLDKLYQGYFTIHKIYQNLYESNSRSGAISGLLSIRPSTEIWNSFQQHYQFITQTLNFERLREMSKPWRKSFFLPGYDSEIDSYDLEIDRQIQYFNSVAQYLTSVLEQNVEFEIDIPPADNRKKKKLTPGLQAGFLLSEMPKKHLTSIDSTLGTFSTFVDKRGIHLSSNILDPCFRNLENMLVKLEAKLQTVYSEFLNSLNKFCSGTLSLKFKGMEDNPPILEGYHQLISFISLLDYGLSNTKAARKYKYFRPKLDLEAERPYFQVEDARHPLIERIIHTEYIPNSFGLGSKTNQEGILLFGVNSSGKTSIGKTAALLLIMAQAGMYVPAKMVYSPYSRIITRLTGNDDLLNAKSSFVVEMTELRTILRMSDDKTLVVGDEICRGTETLSAVSLMIASVNELLKRKTSFLFATHLHQLVDHPDIQNCSRMKILHLSVHFDPRLNQLVYDRKLKDGPGQSIYGLEVCRSLALDSEFLKRAEDIRKDLNSNSKFWLTPKKSRYSSNLWMDNCRFCGKSFNLQTHHIKEQHLADPQGFIEHVPKNSESNLLILCQSCHSKFHSADLKFQPIETLNGLYYSLLPPIQSETQ